MRISDTLTKRALPLALAVLLVLTAACSDNEDDTPALVIQTPPSDASPIAVADSTPSASVILSSEAACGTEEEEFPQEFITQSVEPGALAVARRWHTATVLNDGSVLVVGGQIRGGVTASAEAYDPNTAAWEIKHYMNHRRVHHSATLLASGRVLVGGGQPSIFHCPVASAELYNASDKQIDLSDFLVADDLNNAAKRVPFPAGLAIPAGGYLQIELDKDGWPGFALGGDEELGIWTEDGGLVDWVDWDEGQAGEGMSFARVPDGTGEFQTVDTPTPGAANRAGD